MTTFTSTQIKKYYSKTDLQEISIKKIENITAYLNALSSLWHIDVTETTHITSKTVKSLRSCGVKTTYKTFSNSFPSSWYRGYGDKGEVLISIPIELRLEINKF